LIALANWSANEEVESGELRMPNMDLSAGAADVTGAALLSIIFTSNS
jgi:hypothetical protein